MPPVNQSAEILRFGTFELNLRTGELRKQGVRIKLQEQPLRVLTVLLQCPGEVVTREALRTSIWPADTFVDFDNSLNTSINKLREALGDSADNPRFIETLPRRGYRFIAPVTSDDAKTPSTGATSDGRSQKLRLPAAMLVVVAALVAGGLSWRSQQRRLTEKDTIVLGDFANSTGDGVFDDTLKEALSVAMRQSPFLNVLSDDKVGEILRMMTRPASTALTPDVAREVCQRAGSKAYVVGSIASLGSEYVLGLKAVNCQNGDTLAQTQATAVGKEKVLDALGEAASKLRGELGESLATVQKFDVPLVEATTSSLEALKEYSLGYKVFHQQGLAAALPYAQRATQIDPNFAMGYWAVGTIYLDTSQPMRASEYFTKAFQLREHVSEPEKLTITADYYSNVTGELDKATQTYQEQIENYPRNEQGYAALGFAYTEQGQWEKALEMHRQSLHLNPENVAGFVTDLLALQRLGEARQTMQQAQGQKNSNLFPFHATRYALAFLGSDSPAMGEQQEWFRSRPEYEHFGLSLASDTEAYAGRLSQARELNQRAIDSAIRTGSKENAAIWKGNAAVREAAFGNAAEARQAAEAAIKLAPASQAAEIEAALAFAIVADARGEALVHNLGKRYPLDTLMQSLWLPTIQAQLALARNNPAESLNRLQAAASMELGQVWFENSISCLYPVYVRGEAYLTSGQGSAAAAEFQKIIDHSGIVSNCWTGALARLGVARANAMQAKTSQSTDADLARARALAAYKDFFTLWKDADHHIPIYQQAKAAYAELQ